jgi:quaternary ammonium compound-resistance protein SugE
MAWLLLFIAGVLEIGWAIGLKYSDGFTRPLPSALTIAAMIASMYLLAQSARHIPIGTAYAVWTGIGAAGTAILGIALFSESRSLARLACLALVIGGIAGLKYFAQVPESAK